MSGDPRTLVLVRHAKAARPPATPDHDRGLTGVGVAQARALGDELAAAGLVPDLALVSTAARARSTWHELAGQWQDPVLAGVQVVFTRAIYDARVADLVECVEAHAESERTVLVCGHEPSISALARELTGEDGDTDARAGVQDGMRTGSAAVLQLRGDWAPLAGGRLVSVLDPTR